MIKALTVMQPWATLIAIGAKRIETRPRNMHYRGPLAIHAGKSIQHLSMWVTEPMRTVLREAGITSPDQLPLGAVLCIVDIVDVVPIVRSPHIATNERHFGDYTPGRYGIVLSNVRMFDTPIQCSGKQGLWNWQPPKPVIRNGRLVIP